MPSTRTRSRLFPHLTGILFVALLPFSGGCSRFDGAPATVLDVRQICGRSMAEVEAVLGRPTLTKTTTVSFDTLETTVPAAHYRNGNVHIAYVDGKAAGIYIDLADLGANEVKFQALDVLRAIGLAFEAPARERPGVYMQWTDYPGFLQIFAVVYPPTGGAGAVSLWYRGVPDPRTASPAPANAAVEPL